MLTFLFFRPCADVLWVSRAPVHWVFFPRDEFHLELQVLDSHDVFLYTWCWLLGAVVEGYEWLMVTESGELSPYQVEAVLSHPPYLS